jgi:hypothetical protein
MEKVINISRETLVKNPKGGMTIAFRYADEDGNLDKFIRLGYICDWDEVYDEVGLFYMDIVLTTQSGEVVENSNELHCEFDSDRMSDIRLATEYEVRLLSESLIPSRTQLMIEEQEDAIATFEIEEEKEQKWKEFISNFEKLVNNSPFTEENVWGYLQDKAREEGW